uniref:protein FANTASTIC FOUR 3-like n=1 Tax=Erigeron canadensis TaxID=72917 RepID=UPI001CB954CA|nr:protein FANTASTIC FOUR 3-like [Erigeron canadensis]
MSTILFQQSSQPSMDSPHVVEATTMILKLVSPKPYNQKTLFSSWNLVQSPSSHKPIDDCFNNQETNSYVHNHKSFILSQKSLEICTESLGSETGSDTSEDDTFFACKASSLTKRTRKEHVSSKKMSSRSFPPPLTTISGSKPFQVRPHREGGRLIIEAMETNLGTNSLIAERSHGRLRLTCWKTEEEGEVDTENNENDKKELENNEEEMERNVLIENIQRVRRCNEDEHGDKGLCSRWEPCCWVATS